MADKSERVLGPKGSLMTTRIIERKYRAGRLLFASGDSPDYVYYIHTGQIQVSRVIRGHRVVIHVAGPGEIIGEMSVIASIPRSMDAIVLEDCECHVISGTDLHKFIDKSQPIVRALLRRLIGT